MSASGEDFLATPRALLMEDVLGSVRAMAKLPNPPIDDIRKTLDLAHARLEMLGRRRPGRTRERFAWLAKVTSFAFPRTFFTAPRGVEHPPREHQRVCFTVEVTEGGGRQGVGREIEVQLPLADAMKFGAQMVRVAQQLATPQSSPHVSRVGRQTSPSKGDRLT